MRILQEHKTRTTLSIFTLAVLAAWLYSLSPNIADGDSFLYIGQAYRLRTESLFDVSFPWFQHSLIGDLGISLWYGFFILLIPFSFFPDLVLGIKIAGIVFAAAALCIYYWISAQEKFKVPLLWPLIILGAAPNTMFRFLMVRMQILTVPLSALLLWCLVRGRVWSSAAVTFAIVWIHGNLAWLPFLVLGVAAPAIYLFDRRLAWRETLAVIAGCLGGWLLRPHPLAAARVFYAQIIEHSLVKKAGLPLLFGAEHFPLLPATFFRNFLVFAIAEFIAIGFFIWILRSRENSAAKDGSWKGAAFLASALVISSAFFLLTMFFSRRAYDLWVAFGALFIGGTAALVWQNSILKQKMKIILATLGIALLIFTFGRSILRTKASMDASGYRVNQEQEVAEWIKHHSNDGDIVFNIRWSRSQQLFFWNQKNYYVGGFDPIFEYAKNGQRYWKHHYIAEDNEVILLGKTCGAPECTSEMLEDIYLFIRDELGASFVLVEQNVNKNAYHYFSSDKRFQEVFNTEQETVFKVKQEEANE